MDSCMIDISGTEASEGYGRNFWSKFVCCRNCR